MAFAQAPHALPDVCALSIPVTDQRLVMLAARFERAVIKVLRRGASGRVLAE
jgi:hypothetical protein